MDLLHTHISKLSDQDILSLLGELKEVTMAEPEPGIMLLHYLQACHHPFGADGKWQRIDKDRLTPGRILSRRIGKLQTPGVRQLCQEIAQIAGLGSMEGVETMALYEFFNKHTPHPLKKPKKRPHDPRDTLWKMGF